jgi:hypothetical protein
MGLLSIFLAAFIGSFCGAYCAIRQSRRCERSLKRGNHAPARIYAIGVTTP